jgi:predicted nucleotidyltransferase
MKLDTTQLIGGYPILRIRDMFKRQSEFSCESVEWLMKLSTAKATRLIKELVQLGYLEFMPPRTAAEHADKTKWYELTSEGRTSALARAVPPMKREKAEKLLAEFMDRVQEVNTSPGFLYKVDKVLVFGSYLRPEVTELNDVAVELTTKFADPDERRKASDALVATAYKAGRSFSGFMDQLLYPYSMTKTFLRNRSRYLSLHTTDDEVLHLTETRQIFPITA